jgi:hypothetical protein
MSAKKLGRLAGLVLALVVALGGGSAAAAHSTDAPRSADGISSLTVDWD